MAETWDALEDWEEWDPESGTSFLVHAAAGSIAGTAEHCAIFPVDTIKTHMQTEGAGRSLLREMVAREGFARLWRGVSTMLAGCIPAHAAYFSLFEQSKILFGADQEGHTPLAAAACGAVATVGHDGVLTPFDLIKQRLQLGFHSGMWDCARHIVRTEGLAALYISFPTTLAMNVPFAAIMVSANESFKKVLNPTNEYNLTAFFLSGGLAGGVAAAITNPLDVIKTRLQTQHLMFGRTSSELAAPARSIGAGRSGGSRFPFQLGASPFASGGRRVAQPSFGLAAPYYSRACRFNPPGMGPAPAAKGTTTLPVKGDGVRRHGTMPSGAPPARYLGFVDAAKRIYANEGPAAFARGVRPRIMVSAPSVAISWTAYETAKSALGGSGLL